MKAQPDYSIYLVTDDGCLQGRALIDCVREALEGGVTLVQYRAKTASSAEMYNEALQLKALCDSFNVPLIINDRLDIAMAVGAAGVHLGQDALPCAAARTLLGEDYIIGGSAHNPAAGAGVQYLKLKQRLRGGRNRDENAEKLIFKSSASAFRDENSKYAWINSDPALVEAYAADPHCAFPGTVDGYLSLLELMLGAYDRRNWDNVNNLLPVFIAVGACDPCAAGEKGASAGEKYLKSLGFVRTEHQVYPGMRHEIHNEPRGTQVMDDMLNRLLLWL